MNIENLTYLLQSPTDIDVAKTQQLDEIINEYPYFQLALNKILEYFQLMTYGDDAESVASSFNELLITTDFKFSGPKEDDWAYSYLESVNTELEKEGLVALVTKGYYNIIVCDIENKEQLTNLFEKFKWELVQP